MVEKKFIEVDPFDNIVEFNEKIRHGGLLLVSNSNHHPSNIMTIGWGFLGIMWGRPVIIVAVRHSRHTFKLLEETGSFTVCIPSEDMSNVLEFCGSKSGKNYDKFSELKLSAKKSFKINATYIEECPIFFECSTIFKVDMPEGRLDANLEQNMYKTKDLHMLYFGEIVGVYSGEQQK
ncbi:flavin reductase family protein [Candidatus Bathyarchaeota archaeon]|nr:flavin reductase family protein [Candidatus Bathyarchaeota archaeon]